MVFISYLPRFQHLMSFFLLLLISLGLLISHHGWDYFHYFFTFLALLMSHSGWKYDTSCANIRHFCHTSCISCTSCINHKNPSSVSNMYILFIARPSVNYAKDWLGWTTHPSLLVLSGVEKGFTVDMITRGQSTTVFQCSGPFSAW